LSDNSKKEKRDQGEMQEGAQERKEKDRKKERKMRRAEHGAACWRVRINKSLY
jgi:glutamyl/glutaminyl-tRNA synthetase